MIEVQGVSKVVQDATGKSLTLLDQINLTIGKGEVVAIVGPSGSGKTTLMSVMAGLDGITSGDIKLMGQSMADLSEDQRAEIRRGRVGFVFQNFQLIDGMTALENVQMPMVIADVKDSESRSANLLSELGLGQRLHQSVNKLSGGEQQRVALARAFASDPQLLFADEPTGNLDSATGENIIEALFKLREQKGCTLVMVTHDIELAARCDRRYQVIAGKLEELP
ncbi:MAG: ABC transporter ATP-binding protein [Gammaproteobacteria bacterium]|nr:ABC transporter ATP-binding protein [Gammaproteobacteria bacterium]